MATSRPDREILNCEKGGREEDGNAIGRTNRSASTETAKCPICLGDVENKCRTNACGHQFCFDCLKECSKIKLECPVCRRSFRAIYYNFQNCNEYEEYVVPSPVQDPLIDVQPPGVVSINPFENDSRNLTIGDSGEVIGDDGRVQGHAVQINGYENRRRRYDRNEWVLPFNTAYPSVEFIRSHGLITNRLRIWLFRELNVLLGHHHNRVQMAFVHDLIMFTSVMYDIRSQEFHDLIRTYFEEKTAHFQHELYHFILSDRCLEDYDRIAEYPTTTNSEVRSAQRNNPPEEITFDSNEQDADDNAITRPSLTAESRIDSNIITSVGFYTFSRDSSVIDRDVSASTTTVTTSNSNAHLSQNFSSDGLSTAFVPYEPEITSGIREEPARTFTSSGTHPYPLGMRSLQVIDLSRSTPGVSSNRTARNISPGVSAWAPPVLSSSTSAFTSTTESNYSLAETKLLKVGSEDSDDECVCLGECTIPKMPSVAVVNLSSDDEED